jgi:23S rRNA pseudouridine2457 synthase
MRYLLVYKPFEVLSQFTPESGHATLADLGFAFPKDVYPVGRLDADSEGLLMLTNDSALKHRLLEPMFAHRKTYWIQVEGEITQDALLHLRQGVDISVNGQRYHTLPAQARAIDEPALPPRTPPIRFRASIPTSWLELALTEGKNRQVRKMTAAVGFPTLRLLRARIGSLALEGMEPGQVRELTAPEAWSALR